MSATVTTLVFAGLSAIGVQMSDFVNSQLRRGAPASYSINQPLRSQPRETATQGTDFF